MNKSHTTGWVWSLAAAFLMAVPAFAGPLDRQDVEPRRNPAMDTMIRVPGVIGMDYQGAMQTLQQAGLNPILKTEKNPNPRYEGREGTVVQQLPLPGGMAMLGSSVTITYYQPAQTPPVGGGPPPEQESSTPSQQRPSW